MSEACNVCGSEHGWCERGCSGLEVLLAEASHRASVGPSNHRWRELWRAGRADYLHRAKLQADTEAQLVGMAIVAWGWAMRAWVADTAVDYEGTERRDEGARAD